MIFISGLLFIEHSMMHTCVCYGKVIRDIFIPFNSDVDQNFIMLNISIFHINEQHK